jgi:hypothetical protein
LKERHKSEVEDLIEENHNFQLKVDESKDRDLARQLRRDLEEYKRRCGDLQSETNELRKERDQIKLDKNE